MNVISLNNKILSLFSKEEEETCNKLAIVDKLLAADFSNETISSLKELKAELEKREFEKNTFISKTNDLVQAYLDILNTPLSIRERKEFEEKKNEIYKQYVEIAGELIASKKWTDITIPRLISDQNTECDVCKNDDQNQFEIDESNKKYCLVCSTQHDVLEAGVTSHKDYDRINVVTKFAYSRIIHFQECVKQYQGKQTCKVPQEVFDKLEQKFKALRLLNDSDNNHVKYSRITKDNIMMFLKQLNYSSHYENANYIYYVLTGKRLDDIDYIEERILEDFKELSSLYDEIYGKDKPKELKRKNFMNVQYILFQLLRNRHHMCKLEDFAVLKTIEKKKFHDEICSHLFDLLGWNFTPTF